MARNPIVFENGTLVSNAKVEINGVIYDVEPEIYEGATPLSASNLNQLQNNLYDYVDDNIPDYSDLTTLCNWTPNTTGGGGGIVNMNDDMTKYSQLIILISETNNDTTGNAFYEIVNPLILKQLCNASGGKAYNIIYDMGDSINYIRFTYNSDTALRFWQTAGITQTLYMKVYGVI